LLVGQRALIIAYATRDLELLLVPVLVKAEGGWGSV
jgi:hypothetical protein